MCENVNWKSLGMSLLAVAAAAENLLKKQRWSAAAFSAKKTAALPLVTGDEKKQRRYRKSSSASSARWWTAPLCPSMPRTQRGSVFLKKGLRSKCSQDFRKLQAISKKTKKKGFRSQIHKFSTKFVRQKLFLQVLLRAPRRNNIAHDIGTFSTDQKIVLSSSRGLAGFEAKAKDFTFEA